MVWVPIFMVVHSTQVYILLKPLFSRHKGIGVQFTPEPTGAVDTRTADTIYELFHKLNKELGITIIIVTHDMALAGRVDRTVLISDGKVSTEKLKKHPAMEYTVLDKAHRIKLTDEMLEAAGIESNKVRVDVQDGRLVISRI